MPQPKRTAPVLRIATIVLLTTASAAVAVLGGSDTAPTGSPADSACIPTYRVADARQLTVITDAADRTNETTAGSIETDLAAARLTLLDGPAALSTDRVTLDRLIGETEALLVSRTPAVTVTLARVAPAESPAPKPSTVTVPAGSYALLVAPVVEFDVIVNGCPNAAGQIGKATIRINPLPWAVAGVARRCAETPIDVDRIADRFKGYTNAVTQPELDAIHAARCAG